MARQIWVLLHRYIGLGVALFLIVVGITGSLLVFYSEMDRLVSPNLYASTHTGTPLSLADLAERAESFFPQARINGIYLDPPGTAVVYFTPRINPDDGKPFVLSFNSVSLNHLTGQELGRRKFGAIAEGWENLMPFVAKLHYNLALDKFGMWVLGIIALLWTLDCLVSLYLTLPAIGRLRKSGAGTQRRHSFWHRWKTSWLVKWQASSYRINFDLHRAGGLWLWAALLVFAWSSVFMNLHDQVYAPVTRLFFDYPQRPSERLKLEKPLEDPALGWRQAHHVAERLMAEQARLNGFVIERPVNFWINRAHGTYHYVVHSSLDFQDKRGRTVVIFDANTGELKQLLLPSGQHNGVTVTNWLQTLHEANVFGLPYRIFVAVLGLAITMLSVTGVYIWWKKRKARLMSRLRRDN